jgi:hypothetical protein
MAHCFVWHTAVLYAKIKSCLANAVSKLVKYSRMSAAKQQSGEECSPIKHSVGDAEEAKGGECREAGKGEHH